MTTSPSSSSSPSLGPALTAIVKHAKEDLNTNESTNEFINWMKSMTTGKPGRRDHIKSRPMFELSTISINPHSSLYTGQFFVNELYGHVKFIDDNDTEFHLFHRPVHDPLCVTTYLSPSPSFPCSLILLRGSDHTRPLWLPKFCRLDVCLKDKLTDMVIVEDVIHMDFTSKVVYDKEQECHLHSASLAKLTYIVHSYAVIASVDCTLLKKDDDDDDDASVGSDDFGFATIAATYMGRNRQPVSRILVAGDKLSLDVSRSFWLAVPAYSPMLKLGVNLSGVDGTTYRSDNSLEFVVCDGTVVPYMEDIVVGKWLIRLSVTWRQASEFYFWGGKFYSRDCHFRTDLEKASLEESDEEFLESEEEMDWRARCVMIPEEDLVLGKRKRLLSSIEDPPLDKRISSIYSTYPLHLVEVFSIAIFSYDEDDPITLSADSRIKVDDTIGSHDMLFSVQALFLVRPGNILRVNDPCRRCFLGHGNFDMELDLKDVRGREISKGYLIWDYHSVNNWHDRRICSVVPGNDGFAAVHYTIFEDAVQARVKAVFTGDDDRGCAVMGRICCRYTRYRYFTSYEKRYYQSVLFERNEADFALLSDGHEVPLSKSVVCVPVVASLIVKVELRVMVDGCVEKLRGRLLYKADEEAKETKIRSQPQSIKGSKYGVSVFVEWGTGPDDDYCLGDPKPN